MMVTLYKLQFVNRNESVVWQHSVDLGDKVTESNVIEFEYDSGWQ